MCVAMVTYIRAHTHPLLTQIHLWEIHYPSEPITLTRSPAVRQAMRVDER